MNRNDAFIVMALLACCAASELGCATKMTRIDRALNTYDRALKFTINMASSMPLSGQPLHLDLSLEHVGAGAAAITACIGYSREYRVLAVPLVTTGHPRKPLDADLRLVDHPGCERRFTLQPHERLTWQETSALDIGPGPAALSGWIAVVHPGDCDRFGCYETHLESPAIALTFK